MKEEFKAFVKERPYLIDYVNKGDMTWQKFYELYSLYGESSDVWNKYKKDETINLSGLTDILKKVDMDQVKKGVNGLQKIIELVQGLLIKDEVEKDTYEPRRLFKKFED